LDAVQIEPAFTGILTLEINGLTMSTVCRENHQSGDDIWTCWNSKERMSVNKVVT